MSYPLYAYFRQRGAIILIPAFPFPPRVEFWRARGNRSSTWVERRGEGGSCLRSQREFMTPGRGQFREAAATISLDRASTPCLLRINTLHPPTPILFNLPPPRLSLFFLLLQLQRFYDSSLSENSTLCYLDDVTLNGHLVFCQT